MSEVFRELSQSLGEEERKALLKRISDSLNFRKDVDENIYHKDPGREERQRLIEADIARLNWFQRFILWLKQTFTGKSLLTAFNESRLSAMRRTIARKVPGFAGFDTQVLYPRFAQRVFELFKAVVPLRDPFKKLWDQSEYFQAVLTNLIEDRLEAPKQHIEDLISTEEMVALYAEKGTRTAIRNEVAARLENYTSKLDDSIFTTLQESILPVYYLKELVMFPFNSFFQYFHYVSRRNPEEDEPFFKNASANLVLDMLERLYYAVYVITKIDQKLELDGRLVGDLFREEDGDDRGAAILQDVKNAVKAGQKFYDDVPLSDIIRFYKNDPYYQLIFYMPTMNLKDFYLSVLKMRLLSNVDEVFSKVRDIYIEREVAKFFQEKRYINFQHYRVYTSIDYKTIELPFFIHTRSINLVHNYLHSYYKEQIQELVRILERSVLDQNRITRDRLLSYAANIEDLEEKIKQFDLSLSTDAEDGKMFQRLRFTLAGDPTHQRMFRTLVVQKDREVKALLERSHESLGGLSKVFQEILMSKSDAIRIQLRSHFLFNGKSNTLETLLRHWADHIDRFLNLFNQVLRIEKGRSA